MTSDTLAVKRAIRAFSKGHEHHFDKEITKKVLLHKHKGSVTGYDIIKMRQCDCGKTQAFDLERTIV